MHHRRSCKTPQMTSEPRQLLKLFSFLGRKFSLLSSLPLSTILFLEMFPLRLAAELTSHSLASPFLEASKNKYIGIIFVNMLANYYWKTEGNKIKHKVILFYSGGLLIYNSWLPLQNGKLNALASAPCFNSQGWGPPQVLPFFVWRPLFPEHRPAEEA